MDNARNKFPYLAHNRITILLFLQSVPLYVNAAIEVMILVWVVGFIVSWLIWFIFANKKRWKEILPVSIFASWISFAVEAWMHYVYNLWSYAGSGILPLFGNAFGIYLVVPYFFIQYLPQERTLVKMLVYLFLWADFAIVFEFLHWYFSKIEYHLWWNIGFSYLSDWLLFWIFFKYYVSTNLQKLSK